MKLSLFSSASLLLILSSTVAPQSTTSKSAPKTKTSSTKPGANADTEQQQRVRRGQARSLLMALSTDARTFADAKLRARSLARIADALYQADAEQARLMFRRAWDAAEVADRESEFKVQNEIQQQKARSGGSYVINTPPNVRREVLRLAAHHDRVLSEEFLEKLKAERLEAADSATSPNRNPGRLAEDLGQRLSVARELMLMGEIEKALQFADPSLNVVAIETVSFLSDVREKAPVLADNRYALLLRTAAANPESDANTISLLSSYIFTPHLFIVFSGGGTSTSQKSPKIVPAEVSPELRLAFLQTAAAVLLRPLPTTGTDPNSDAIDARYLVIKRLLPFFEESAPTDMVESLRGQLNALSAVVTEGTRRRDDEWINKGVKPDTPLAEQEQALLDRIDRAKTSAERDSLNQQMAFLLARRGDMRARDFVSKIDDTELRKGLQSYIDSALASHFVGKKLTDQALELAIRGDLTHIQKTWVFTECAKILVKTDRDKALELVEAAATAARRMDVSDPMLPRGLLAVANALMVIDPPRAWDATFDAVKAANSAEGFTGEDGVIAYQFQSKHQSSSSSSSVAEFDVEGIFRQLATQDYERAVELARGFQGEGPRAIATISIARAVLDEKRSAVKN